MSTKIQTNSIIFLLIFGIFCFIKTEAWDGYDWDNSEYVEVERGNLVRTGSEIEVYHWGDNNYHYEEVQSITNNELETYDYDSGEYHTYDMD